MSRLVLLHAADLHLDAPFEGVGRTPAPIAAALRDASVDAWDALVELALDRAVAAVLLAGGLCAGLERGVRAQARLREGLTRLGAAGIPAFVALGDDDPPDGFAAIPEWPPSVTVFPSGMPVAVPLQRDGRHVATIHGVSVARPSRGDVSAPPPFTRGAGPGPHLAVVHASVAGHASDDGASCLRLRASDLRAAGMDYWALGHAAATDRLSADAPWIVFAGTPQGRNLTPAHCGSKGAVLIEIEGGGVTGVDLEPVDRVRCVRVEMDDVADPASLQSLLCARATELRHGNPGRGLLLDGRIGGTPAVCRMLRQPAARAELLRVLRAAAERLEPFVWWVGVRALRHEVGAPGDDLTEGDLAAEIALQRAALADDAARCAGFVARQFEPLQALWTADVDGRETAELLDEAAALAVDALHGDGG